MNVSRARKGRSEEPGELPEELVCAGVKQVLLLDQSKKIIKHSEVLNAIGAKIPRKRHREFFEAVRENLDKIGLMLHLDPCGQPTMFLSSPEKPESFMIKFASEEEKADRTLLVLVLSYTFMKDDVITEDEIFKMLDKLTIISENSSHHHYFGDVKKKIQHQFVDELYLRRVPTDIGQVEVFWGVRAEAELSKKDILSFVCEVAYDNLRQPFHFTSQFKKASEQSDEKEEDSEESD